MRTIKAFTLAEALITLMIIGVISAITIPTIKKISDEHTYVTAAKKAYSTISNATKNLRRKEGPVKTWVSSSWTNIRKMYQEEMTLVPMSASGGVESYSGQYLNGTSYGSFRAEMRSNDGMTYEFWGSSTCSDSSSGNYKNACARIAVDTNGKNDPNIIGVDRVGFYITSDGSVYPYGTGNGVETETSTCVNNGKKGTGWGCTARMITEGKISW